MRKNSRYKRKIHFLELVSSLPTNWRIHFFGRNIRYSTGFRKVYSFGFLELEFNGNIVIDKKYHDVERILSRMKRGRVTECLVKVEGTKRIDEYMFSKNIEV